MPVESMSGPFPREPAAPPARPTPKPRAATEAGLGVARPPSQRPTAIPVQRDATAPRVGPPPGMTDADVNALYTKYVKAKQMVGEDAGPGAYGKLLKTINAQAPKIMEQYQAKGVDFSVVVKDNQVIIKAKPKP
ncbi:MAG: MXAN_5187 C-terminal domain-containing protein [Kofleriaceae bacterium]